MIPALLAALIAGASPNLLEGLHSSAHPALNDDVLAQEGSDWMSPGAVELHPEAWPQWDLGSSQQLAGASLQADHNDRYIVSVSEDGQAWTDAVALEPIPEGGLRTRAETFSARGRFVRLRAEGGDGRFSATELQLFSSRLSLWTSSMRGPVLPRDPLAAQWAWLVLATAIALCVVTARSPRWQLAVAALGLAGVAGWVLQATFSTPAIAPSTISWMRAAVAFAAFLAILRTALFSVRAPARVGLVQGVLAVSGVLGVLLFLNLARPQYYDVGRNAPTFLHHYDMRVYFPIAKYFPEVRFDGVYAASAAVVAEDTPDPVGLMTKTLTNLRTHQTQTIGESQEYIRGVRARFSPERWAGFVTDMRYFRQSMGDTNFIGSMYDHGGNATPVWFLGSRLLFGNAPASDATLWVGVALDAFLVLLAFAALGWAYGLRTALITMTIFGAMDFYLFGNNWFGSPLRHDWLALWGMGLAMLKKERFFLGGGLLTWAALIRVFPMLSLLTLATPAIWAFGRELIALRLRFSIKAFLRAQQSFVRVVLGAFAFGTVLLVLSVIVFGTAAWPDWTRKIALMAGAGLNTVGLSSVVTTPWILTALTVVITAITLFAIRNSPLDEAAAFGTTLVGIIFSPMNYYLHCMCLPVVIGQERRVLPWLALLGMCVGCYFTTLTQDITVHFRREAWVLLSAVAALVSWQLVRSVRREPPPVVPPSPEVLVAVPEPIASEPLIAPPV